ncbi:peptidylprolyl isomerase [Geotalea sp. SG265]|uniref:peptidylprolyl isomerase n=1 Tax=Geotalea sp. SG265 TaxID=2922867 RepID=UPI001FAF68E2|nr:peptidylprolyl isomerase [Geotalea sp. SG265]
MNKLLLYCIIAALSAFPAAVRGETVSAIAAIVNDDVITTLDVQKEADQIAREVEKKNAGEVPDKATIRKTALDRLIDKKLVEQKIKELDIKVPEEELRQSIEDVKKQNNLTQEALVAALAGQGLSFEQYKNQLREQLERLRLMSQEVRSKIQVGEREVREYYEANKARYGQEEFFHARHIFFKVDKNAPETEKAKVMATATRVLQEARSGKDFAELARQYSDDPAAKQDGGDLGTFKKGDMIAEIEAAVGAMKPGDVSDLVKTAAGLHIIKLEERGLGKPRPLDEVKGEIEDLLYKKKSEERFNQWVDELRKGAAIEIKR